MSKYVTLIIASVLSLFSVQLGAQDMLSSTKLSQRASITQRIGTTDVTIVYHSPLANGRKIFGGIVPYDFVVNDKEFAWRAGSNQRTTIEFTHDVKIEGKPLAAGKYGLVVLVSEKEWTFVFSTNMTWGAFQYSPENDVLRVTVETESASDQNWLSYDFIHREAASVKVVLRWEQTMAGFTVATDVSANILADLSKKKDKDASDYMSMSIETLKKDPGAMDEAMALIEQSIQSKATFHNKMRKADLLIQSGRKAEGNQLREETLATAKGFDMYYYGLSPYLLRGDKKESYRLLMDNVKKYPDAWIAHLALGEYYIKAGNQKKVVEHMKRASELAPDNWRNYATYLYQQNRLILERK